MSSQLFHIGGLGYRICSRSEYPLQECRNDWFRPFLSCGAADVGLAAGDEICVTVEPMGGDDPMVGYDRVLEHKGRTHILKGDGIYRIQTFGDYVCRDLKWTTQFGPGLHYASSRTTELIREDGGACLPGVGAYPHFRFLLPWHLAARGGVWIHCAGAVRNGQFFFLAGRSGKGKSTIARILHDSGLFRIASDEVNVVRHHRGSIMGYGTPWYSSAHLCGNISGPAKGLFFLEHARENRMAPMATGEALQRMLKQVFLPWYDEATLNLVLSHLERLVQSTPCWTLAFRPDEEVSRTLADFVDGL